jgi:hypothetical protein
LDYLGRNFNRKNGRKPMPVALPFCTGQNLKKNLKVCFLSNQWRLWKVSS